MKAKVKVVQINTKKKSELEEKTAVQEEEKMKKREIMLSNCTPTFLPTNPPAKTSPPASSTTTSTPSRRFVPVHWFTYGNEEGTQKDKKEKLMEKKNVEDDEKGKRKEWTFEEWMNCKPGEDPF